MVLSRDEKADDGQSFVYNITTQQTDRQTDGRSDGFIAGRASVMAWQDNISHVTGVFSSHAVGPTFSVPAFFGALACQYLSTYVGAPERIPGKMIISEVFRCAT